MNRRAADGLGRTRDTDAADAKRSVGRYIIGEATSGNGRVLLDSCLERKL